MKKVLITGGAGYLGQHLAKVLHDDGNLVYCIDRVPTKCPYYHQMWVEDLNCSEGLSTALKMGMNTVFHLAGRIEVCLSWKQPIRFWRDNVYSTMNVLGKMKKYGVNNIVYSSSAGVYEPKEQLITEQDPIAYNNPYANSKIAAEKMIQDSGLNSVIFRFFNLAGADSSITMGESHDPETHLIPLLFQNSNNFTINGDNYQTKDGTCIRDYVHVSDVAEANLLAMNYLNTWKQGQNATINLGTGVGYSILEIINLCKELLGLDIKYEVGPRRSGDPSMLVANIDHAKSFLGYKPKYDISDILKTAYSWYIKNEHR